jgi:pyroglutamyl-peptidase
MKILVTGFEPFGEHKDNVTEKLIAALPKKIGVVNIVTQVLPVVYYRSSQILTKKIQLHNPSAVISLGLAAGSSKIQIETSAQNKNSARIPDNKGNAPMDEPVIQDGEDFFPSNLPIALLYHSLKHAGYPVALSQSAGTYVCNHVFYHLMNHVFIRKPSVIGGFIHYPQEDKLSFQDQKSSLILLIKTIIASLEPVPESFS